MSARTSGMSSEGEKIFAQLKKNCFAVRKKQIRFKMWQFHKFGARSFPQLSPLQTLIDCHQVVF